MSEFLLDGYKRSDRDLEPYIRSLDAEKWVSGECGLKRQVYPLHRNSQLALTDIIRFPESGRAKHVIHKSVRDRQK